MKMKIYQCPLTTIKVSDEIQSEIITGKSDIQTIPTTFKCGAFLFSLWGKNMASF